MRILLTVCFLVISLLAEPTAFPLVLTPTADTFVTSAQPDANYGAAGALQIASAGSPKGQMFAYLRFDLATAFASFNTTYGAGNWTVSSLTLTLNTNFGTQGVQPNNAIFNPINAGDFTISWVQKDDWLEGTGNPNSATTDGITFNSQQTSAADQNAGTFNWPATGNVAKTYALTLTSGILADASTGSLLSLGLAAAPGSSVSYLFNSRTNNSPTLTINAAPEPGTAFLLLATSAVHLATRRRRIVS